jgi:hypothetical protein
MIFYTLIRGVLVHRYLLPRPDNAKHSGIFCFCMHMLACILKDTTYMTTRKNVPRPVITTNQKNGVDYVFLTILLLFLFIFLGTVMCKTKAENNRTGMLPGEIKYAHALV